jgi:hypothetical protein
VSELTPERASFSRRFQPGRDDHFRAEPYDSQALNTCSRYVAAWYFWDKPYKNVHTYAWEWNRGPKILERVQRGARNGRSEYSASRVPQVDDCEGERKERCIVVKYVRTLKTRSQKIRRQGISIYSK